MADVNLPPTQTEKEPSSPLYELIELFFFAYRDFVADADLALDSYGFGRAHHRVLHFVDRNQGLAVAELLGILKITKQSLARVLKELIDQGFITQSEGRTDRRQRLLATTDKGHRLAVELAHRQSQRIARALSTRDNATPQQIRQFLFSMIETEEQPDVTRLIKGKSRQNI